MKKIETTNTKCSYLSRGKHIPSPVRPQDKTSVLRDVNRIDKGVGLWTNDKDIFLRVVTPQIT